jgi:hypothetical protein
MHRVLSGMGVVPIVIVHDKDQDKGNGGGGGGRDCIEEYDNNNDAVRKGELLSSYSSCGIRAVVLVNLGANCNLAKLFCFSSFLSASSLRGGPRADIRCYVLDYC